MATQTDIDRDYRKLKILLEATDSFVLTFALYRDAKEQRENAGKLKERLELPVTQVALKGDNLNPVRTFLDLPKEPRQAIFFTFLGSSLPEGGSDFDKFAGYVNIQREAFTDAPHAVVLWLREEQLVRLMRRAPDFWAWRSGVFDFRGELTKDFVAQRELEFTTAHERARLEEQEALYREILKAQLQRDEPDLAYVTRTRLRLGKVLLTMGLYQEMLSEAHEAFSAAQGLGDEDLVAVAYNCLAAAYQALGHYDKAEVFYRERIKLLQNTFGIHEGHVSSLVSLAEVLTEMGRYDEAEPLYKEAEELAEQAFGKRHPTYAFSLSRFANFLAVTKRYDEAEPFYRDAINILIDTFGENYLEYAVDVNNLAELLTKMERYDEAELLFKKAVELTEATVGKEHPYYKIFIYNLADLLGTIGRYDEAEPLFLEALEKYREHLGEEESQTKMVEASYQRLQQERFDVEKIVRETA